MTHQIARVALTTTTATPARFVRNIAGEENGCKDFALKGIPCRARRHL